MNNILVTRSSMPTLEEYNKEIEDLFETHWLTNMGIKHRTLQDKLTEYLKVENVELLTNGHMALELALQALHLPAGGEVITTPFTFASTTHAIVRNNLVPVFCDIREDNYTIDVNKIEALITDKTCAILPVHVYGNACDVFNIEKISRKYNLKVVYDAAHAFGVTVNGKGIGEFGDVSCFSFHATKVFNTIEGGAVTYHNKDKGLGTEIYGLKNFGIRSTEIVDCVGANAKMNEFCAAMGLCNLRHIDEEIAKRKSVYERYISNLNDVQGIILLKPEEGISINYGYFPIVFDQEKFGENRDSVLKRLEKNGIGARKYFYPLTCDFDCYKEKYSSAWVPVARRISRSVLSLPMYADLSFDDIDSICEIIVAGNRKTGINVYG